MKLYDGVLFSKGTVGLDEVAGDKQNYAKYLDTAYINDVSAFDSCGGKWSPFITLNARKVQDVCLYFGH